ncbi:TetR/AcrR family transcriptional regulator (plasmid) [Novosphingobium sp. BL-8A]|uniref:TetR/AcrR family transcriptional regulator n=1 Tax=Novosphingobium sp. BL-8A TaxID=3127639 RepID=UPI0037584551
MTRKRKSDESAGTKKAILDATQQIMCNEGYAAVSSRRVAEVAGLKSQLVHYHFGTMDNLMLALFRRAEEDFLARQVRSLTSTSPLRSLWKESLQQADAHLTIEFIALARHSEAIGNEVRRANETTRNIHSMIIAGALERADIKGAPAPEVVAFFIAALSRTLGTEEALGTSLAHEAVHTFVEDLLNKLEPASNP